MGCHSQIRSLLHSGGNEKYNLDNSSSIELEQSFIIGGRVRQRSVQLVNKIGYNELSMIKGVSPFNIVDDDEEEDSLQDDAQLLLIKQQDHDIKQSGDSHDPQLHQTSSCSLHKSFLQDQPNHQRSVRDIFLSCEVILDKLAEEKQAQLQKLIENMEKNKYEKVAEINMKYAVTIRRMQISGLQDKARDKEQERDTQIQRIVEQDIQKERDH
ncbi:hypothetical protein FGO68_gene17305 [Halteria grandinella]|uniref:Uncharacterized protein n=1 Tax=Halteria grandinella TaxID=5974 RepID=A0A8J8NT50_HALGN|nr:hypothetical protein FGO68_gene17305 [Halteria grandinella]